MQPLLLQCITTVLHSLWQGLWQGWWQGLWHGNTMWYLCWIKEGFIKKKNLYILYNLLQQLYGPPHQSSSRTAVITPPNLLLMFGARPISFTAIQTQGPIMGCRELTTYL
jgi:hypothetical protein